MNNLKISSGFKHVKGNSTFNTVKVVVEYILVGTDVGIWGAPISTLCCTFTIFLLDIIFITVYTPQRFDLAPLCRTALATIFSVGISACAYNLAMRYELVSALSLFIAIFLSLVLLAVSAIIFGAVTYSDLACVKALRPFAEFLKNIIYCHSAYICVKIDIFKIFIPFNRKHFMTSFLERFTD